MSEQDINKVSLLVDGNEYAGWKSVRIEIGINQICRSFALEVTDDFPGNGRGSLEKFTRLSPGQSVVLRIGDDVVCTGYITGTPISYNAKSISVQVQGKSKTVDLVDCCSPWAAIAPDKTSNDGNDAWKDVDPEKNKPQKVSAAKTAATSWHNQPTEKIIADLCAPYGISVVCKSDIGSKHTNFTVNPGEKVYESINRLLVKDNLIVMDDEFGNLVIAEVGQEGPAGEVLNQDNILTGSASFDANLLYSTYAVIGQHKGSDLEFGKQASQDKGIVENAFIGRFRLLVVKDTGQSSVKGAASVASFQNNYRIAKYFSSDHTVQGWRQKNGVLWKANQGICLEDPLLQITDSDQLITKLEYSLNSLGTITKIYTVPKEGYNRKGSKKTSKTSAANNSSNAWADVK